MFVLFGSIPEQAFFKVRMDRNICRAVVNKYSDVAQGKPEVELISSLGYREALTKKQLLDNYRFINGKKIKLLAISSKNPVTVMGVSGFEMAAVYVPSSCTVEFDTGNESASGTYIVCEVNPDGSVNRNKYYFVSRDIFQKIFVMSGDINKLLQQYSKGLSDIENTEEENFGDYVNDDSFDSGFYDDTTGDTGYYEDDGFADEFSGNEPLVVERGLSEPVSQKVSTKTEPQISPQKTNKNKYSVVSKVVDSNKNITALKLRNKETGEIERVEMVFLLTYAIEDGIDGMTVEYRDGKPLLRFAKGVK